MIAAMIRATTFAGKTVAVFGLGASGRATALSLMAGGATVAAWDDGQASRDAAAQSGVPIVDLEAADWSKFAALVLAPGVPLTHPAPHWTALKARAAGIEIIGDIEIFCRERAAHCPDAPFIAITGTNGKSTTTALIAHILGSAGLDVQMGGNIGRAILTLEQPAKDRFHVIEMSSFQIDLTPSLKPTVGVLLNITPDHLDRHGPADDPEQAMQNYAAIKERLVKAADHAVIGIDDELSRKIAEQVNQRRPGCVDAFSAYGQMAPWQGYASDVLKSITGYAPPFFMRPKMNLDGYPTLRGDHNQQNALAASMSSFVARYKVGPNAGLDSLTIWRKIVNSMRSFPGNEQESLFEAARTEMGRVLATYPGLPHRMEEVGRAGRVLFINDSKATNADSTEKALASWERDIFWILGGKSKEGGIASLEIFFPRIAKAYLIGAASDEFAATLDGIVATERCVTLDVAVKKAAADAALSAGAEPVVLLSPACASYDQFKGFDQRGDAFRFMVLALPGVAAKVQK